jgi:hypothetical protein
MGSGLEPVKPNAKDKPKPTEKNLEKAKGLFAGIGDSTAKKEDSSDDEKKKKKKKKNKKDKDIEEVKETQP